MADANGNSGLNNSGYGNSGDMNSGDWNSGDWNSGNRNSGNWNSGNRNSGNWNSGNRNSGDGNSGNRNSGDMNSGDWNSGNYNSGYLNTTKPKLRIFDKETDLDIKDIAFPMYFYDLAITEWVSGSETKEYLKTLSYKEAWRNAWDKASQKDREKTTKLPNWDNAIFFQITGIDVEKELNKVDDATEEAMKLLKSKGFKIIKE